MPTSTRSGLDWSDRFVTNRYSGGSLINHWDDLFYLGGNSVLVSDGHPMHLLGTGADVGGPFGATRCRWVNRPHTINIDSKTDPTDTTFYTHRGPFSAYYVNHSGPPSFYGIPGTVPDFLMNGWGTKGIARTIPTNPLAGVATFVGELRQVPQRFDPLKWKEAIKDLRKLPRRTAEEWLNFNFGYVPVVNDIKKFVDVTAKHDQYVTRLIRNSGKNVRRRVDLYSNQTSDSVVISENAYGTPILATEAYLRTGRVTRSVTTTEKIWFSGCYTYWLPGEVLGKRHGNNISQRKRIRQILYGDKVDVDTLWNLAPWTWALDWIGTSGDVIHNMNAFANDELVMRYGYVMRMYETRVDFALDGVVLRVAGPVSASQTCFLTNKQRSKATPYGFGINPSGFTARQWATIGALGISRVPNSLRV